MTRGWLHPAAGYEAHKTHLHGEVKKSLGVSQVYTEFDQDPVPHALLRKYIAYARTHVHPVLSSEAKQVGPKSSPHLVHQSALLPEQVRPEKLTIRGYYLRT